MPHRVRDWMSSPVVVVSPDTTVSYAMTLMRRRNIHSVVVDISEKNKQYGIVTTTDIRDKIVAALDRMVKTAPAGSEVGIATLKCRESWYWLLKSRVSRRIRYTSCESTTLYDVR